MRAQQGRLCPAAMSQVQEVSLRLVIILSDAITKDPHLRSKFMSHPLHGYSLPRLCHWMGFEHGFVCADPRHPNPVLPIPRAGRSYQPGLPGQTGDPTWDHFQERFLKVSRRIVERMGSNVAFMAKSAKEAVERLGGFRDD